MWMTLTLVCGVITVLILALLAFVMWRDPEDGLRQTTHLKEQLPLVMADRYTAFAFLALAFTLLGDVRVLSIFFVACAYMGLTDGWLYHRAGHPHWKHTVSGILSLIAAAIACMALLSGSGASG